jgi:hypothetical protein
MHNVSPVEEEVNFGADPRRGPPLNEEGAIGREAVPPEAAAEADGSDQTGT